MRWGFEGLCLNEFTTAKFSCDDVDVEGGEVCIQSGTEVIKRLGFGNHIHTVLLAMLVFITVEHCLAYLLLRRTRRRYMAMQAKQPVLQG